MFWLFPLLKLFSKKKAAPQSTKTAGGAGFYTLNVVRVCNIISLGTVIAGSWIMLFFFFDAFSHLITSCVAMFLIISELNLFTNYFSKHWPPLSSSHGFLFLGSAMFVLGMNMLGNMNKVATSMETLGLPMWRVVVASGCLSSIFGVVNIIMTFAFGSRKQNTTARTIRAHGASPVSPHIYDKTVEDGDSTRSASHDLPRYNIPTTTPEPPQSRFTFKNIRASWISKPTPMYVEPKNDRSSPVLPFVQRPPTAMHPAYSPSRYSVASRF